MSFRTHRFQRPRRGKKSLTSSRQQRTRCRTIRALDFLFPASRRDKEFPFQENDYHTSFLRLARSYRLFGAPFQELCDHNAKVSYQACQLLDIVSSGMAPMRIHRYPLRSRSQPRRAWFKFLKRGRFSGHYSPHRANSI